MISDVLFSARQTLFGSDDMPHRQETVVLLHGIGHCKLNMLYLEKAFKKRGYKTLNITYPSLTHDIKTLSKSLHERLEKKQVWQNSEKVHFVAHSMGGLVGGFYLQDHNESIPLGKMGRVIMLGTPHKGSEVADGLKDFWLYKLVFGQAGQELVTDLRKENMIKEPDYELGIIAGTKNGLHPLGRFYIHGPHDGCVSVESTQLEGMKDHITMPVLHGLMAWNSKSRKQVIYFIEHGEFKHAG